MGTIQVFSLLFFAFPCLGLIPLGKDKTCFPKLGCFENGRPWTTLLRPALPPKNPKDPFITFYNRKRRKGVRIHIYPEYDLTETQFDSQLDTFHGFTDESKLPWILRLKEALLDRMDENVFIPDYAKDVKWVYAQAVGNIRVLSRIFTEVLDKTNISSSSMHIIGHSLGAQLGSYICKEMKLRNKTVGWLTALDPAGPLFDNFDKEVRLDSSDAEFVDVHHTNSGVQGMLHPVGHVDFYYNGGTKQPPCDIISLLFTALGCPHQIIHDYYISGVKNQCLFGVLSNISSEGKLLLSTVVRQKLTEHYKDSCKSNQCLPVGLQTKSYPMRGIFTVFTTNSAPYCSTE